MTFYLYSRVGRGANENLVTFQAYSRMGEETSGDDVFNYVAG